MSEITPEGELNHCLFHFLAGLELDHSTWRDFHIIFRLIGITPHTSLANFDFENTKITQFNRFSFGNGF